jgi:hypothetical protein
MLILYVLTTFLTYSRASLIRTNWDSGMFGLVNFRINRVLQNTRRRGGGGGRIFPRSLVLSEKSGQGDSNESDSDEATKEVISHAEGLEALELALLYVDQHSEAAPTDVIFMKRWRDIVASYRRSTLYQKKITDFAKKKGRLINVQVMVFCQFSFE